MSTTSTTLPTIFTTSRYEVRVGAEATFVVDVLDGVNVWECEFERTHVAQAMAAELNRGPVTDADFSE